MKKQICRYTKKAEKTLDLEAKKRAQNSETVQKYKTAIWIAKENT